MHARGWLVLALVALPAAGWSPNTHMATARLVRDDVIDDGAITVVELIRNADGTITRHELGSIPIDPDVVEAVTNCEHEFHAGSCSADAYPDMYVGQSIIHPFVPGQPWRATDWARHVVRCAREYGEPHSPERQKALAFAAGWLVHYAGDAFGHTHVNHYAGGAWDWGNMDIVLKHVAYESYINTKIPGAGDETLRRLDMDGLFIAETLMLHDAVQPAITPVGYLKALVDYYHAFDEAVDAIEDAEDSLGGGIFGRDLVGGLTGLGPVHDFCRQQRDYCHTALMEWGETSTRVIRDFTEGDPASAISAVNEWVGDWTAHLVLGVPEGAEELADWLGAPMGWFTDPLKDLMEQTMVWIWEHLIRSTFEDIVNPVDFMLAMHGEAVRAEVDALMGVTPDHPELDPVTFAPFADTVTLGKLALLNNAGMERLGELLGVPIHPRTNDDNLLWDCIESLDASNQLYLYPKFRLLETPELEQRAFRRLFLTEPYQPPASRIDPAHLLIWGGAAPQIVFGVPVEDPLNETTTLIGYVLRGAGGQGELQRQPMFELPVPTSGVAGSFTQPLWGTWPVDEPGLHFFHLATRQPGADGPEPVEDAGINIRLLLQPGGNPPGGQPGGPPGELPNLDEVAGFLEQMLATLEQAQGAMAGLSPEQRAELQQRLAQIREQLAQARAGDQQSGVDPWTEFDQVAVYDQQLLDGLIEAWQESAGETTPPADDLGRPAIGKVLTAAGAPVSGALVTLLARPIFDQLRQATGEPWLRLDDWLIQGYSCGRTNDAGSYLVQEIREGEAVLIASAPGLPKTEVALTVAYGPTHGVLLPEIRLDGARLGGPPAGAGGPPADPPGFGQHQAAPDYAFDGAKPVIDVGAAADGVATVTVNLRPRAGFAGEVTLALDGLPDGLTAEIDPDPVTLAAPTAVTISVRAEPGATGGPVVVRAEGGGIGHELPLYLAAGGGTLRLEPEQLTVAPGRSSAVRLRWDAPDGGRGAVVRLGELPVGLRVEAVRLRANRLTDELPLRGLTAARIDRAVAPLRAAMPLAKAPVPLRADAQQLAALPRRLPQTGVRLGRDGWIELAVTAAANLAPGEYAIPVVVVRGAREHEQMLRVIVEG